MRDERNFQKEVLLPVDKNDLCQHISKSAYSHFVIHISEVWGNIQQYIGMHVAV